MLIGIALAAPQTQVRDAASVRDPTPNIVHGTATSAYPSVVALGVPPLSVCSGNLITPRLVLTAAHCSGEIPLEFVVQFGSAIFGPTAAAPERAVRLADARIHPGYVPLENGVTLGENDIAIAVLVEPVDIDPVPFRKLPLPASVVGRSMTSVGFGIDEADEGGIKRLATLTVSELDPVFVITESEDNPNDANICSGDSGGPQFLEIDGVLEQIAVHSWADVGCTSISGSTRTDVTAGWILDQVEAVHGTRDLCEASGRYDDGICDERCDRIDPDCLPPKVAARVRGEPTPGCSCGVGATLSTGSPNWLIGAFGRR